MPWRREWLPTLVFLPGELHGQRSLVAPVLWGHKELFMTAINNTKRKEDMLAAIGIVDMSLLSKNLCMVGKMKHKQLKSEVQKVK